MLSRRALLHRLAGGAAVAVATRPLAALGALGTLDARGGAPALAVYKSPSCGCCRAWVDHMRKAGFAVTAHDVDDLSPIKRQFGVPEALESCHTGYVGGYVVEGHVPADVVRRALAERPGIRGLAVPGMPSGSPGMEGGRVDRYDVVAFDRAGTTRVYARR